MSQSQLAGPVEGGASLERLPAINGLRAIAITGVLVHHLLNDLLPPVPLTFLGARIPLSPVMIAGQFGVNLFFILSGFVLYLPYAAGRRPMQDGPDARAFYRRRARRLLPLFYCAAITTWLLALMRGDDTGSVLEMPALVSLIFAVFPETFAPKFNPPLWTIGVEILFSVVFPALAMRARAIGMARLTGAVLAFSLIVRLLCIHHAPTAVFPTYAGDNLACRLDEFVLGMMLAHFHAGRRLPNRPRLLFAIGAALFAGAVLGYDLWRQHLIPLTSEAVLANLLDAGLCALVAAALAPGTRLQRVLSWPPLQLPGMMCYSIYIWHWSVMAAVAPAGNFPTIAVPTFLILTLAIAALSYRFIEFGYVADWRALFLLDGYGGQRAGSERSASRP